MESVVLCDFGLAREFESGFCDDEFCGSREYAAPELFRRESYTNKVDMWALGITLYGCLTGIPAASKANLEREILSGLPNIFNVEEAQYLSMDAEDLIRNLLNPNPVFRLSAKDAMEHHWFDSVRSNHI
jgi:serine/threonine protein kinase